jgi:acetyl esterase
MRKSGEWAAARGLPAFWEMPHARAREVYREFITTSGRPMPEMAGVEDIRIPTRAGDCPARLLKPAGDASSPLPVIVYYFSGGYVIGGIDESEHEARRLAARTPAIVVSIGYRVAPAHRFPAAAEDAYDALRWVADNAQRLGALPIGWPSPAAAPAAACQRSCRRSPQRAGRGCAWPSCIVRGST